MISSAKHLRLAGRLENHPGFSLVLRLGKMIRLSSLALLFAGSAAIVFTAVVLVKTGEAHGLTVSEAASANAPVFIHFSKVVAAACVTLLIAEAIDSLLARHFTRLKLMQYVASMLCCLCGFIFAFVAAPLMDHLLVSITFDPQAHQSFHRLHELSRVLFGGMILFAWVSLILPVFASTNSSGDSTSQRNTD